MLRLSTFFSDVLGTVLTGFSTASSALVTASDGVLTALGKLQAQISALIASPTFTGPVIILPSAGTTPAPPPSGYLPGFRYVGGAGISGGLIVDTYGNTANGPSILGRTAKGSITAPTPVTSSTALLNLVGFGYVGSGNYIPSASIRFVAAETWSSTAQGSYIPFVTTVAGTATATEKMRLSSRGNLLIGTTTDDAVNTLQVAGGTKATTLTATAMPTTDPGVAGELWLPPSGAVAVSGTPQVVGLVQSATVSLTSAQILALTTTPIQIIPAPGAGKMILMQGGYYESTFGTTPYTGDVAAYYGSGTATLFDRGSSGIFGQTANTIAVAFASSASANQTLVANQPIMLTGLNGTAMTGGDGSGKVTLLYTVVSV